MEEGVAQRPAGAARQARTRRRRAGVDRGRTHPPGERLAQDALRRRAQRASLARALVREPDLLLLDEPFGALDALTRIKAQRLVGELWRRRGCAVLLVTHDVEEAVLLADRVLVMDGGVIAYETQVDLDRPRDIADPASPNCVRPPGAPGRGHRRLSFSSPSVTFVIASPSLHRHPAPHLT